MTDRTDAVGGAVPWDVVLLRVRNCIALFGELSGIIGEIPEDVWREARDTAVGDGMSAGQMSDNLDYGADMMSEVLAALQPTPDSQSVGG